MLSAESIGKLMGVGFCREQRLECYGGLSVRDCTLKLNDLYGRGLTPSENARPVKSLADKHKACPYEIV